MALPTIFKASSYNSPAVYNNGGGGGGGGDLPEEYTKSVCVTASGNVNLNFTGLDLDINDTYKIKCSTKYTNQSHTVPFCAFINSNKQLYPYFNFDGTTFIMPGYCYRSGSPVQGNWANYSEECIINITAKKRYCNFIIKSYNKTIDRGSNDNDETINNFILFGGGTTPAQKWNGSIYELKVFDMNDENRVKANFIPAYDSNNVLGFYETISGQFVGNANLYE